jgi:hypothetical protein
MTRGLACEIVAVSPEQASELLRTNTRNRSVRRQYVRQLAQAMQRGEWTVNGEPIQVAKDGTLLNGQHRLHAVVESGQTVPMLVVRNVPLAAQRTMDTGARRNLSDVLALRGESHTTNLAAALGLLYRYRNNAKMEGSGRSAPTTKQAVELLEREPGLRDCIPLACRVYRDTHLRISIAIVIGYLFNEVEPGQGTSFFKALCNAQAVPGEPLGELRMILTRLRDEQTFVLNTYTLCGLTVKAFNAWRAGAPLHDLEFRSGGERPEEFPVIGAAP